MFTLVFSFPLFANSFKRFQSSAGRPGVWQPLFVFIPAKTAAMPGPSTWLPGKGPALTLPTSPSLRVLLSAVGLTLPPRLLAEARLCSGSSSTQLAWCIPRIWG